MKLSNKTILITGASDGIGRSTALALAKHDVNLILLGRDRAKLDGVAEHCAASGSRVQTYAFDLADPIARTASIEAIAKTGAIDILINNAGVWHKSTPLGSLSPEIIETVIATNLTAQILLTRCFIDGMKDREAAIINVVSSAGMQGRAGRTAYAASKYGMRGFTEALRDETKENQIRIGAVFQSGTSTEMFAKAGEEMPLEKYTDPNDLADVIVYMVTRPPKLWLNEVHVSY